MISLLDIGYYILTSKYLVVISQCFGKRFFHNFIDIDITNIFSKYSIILLNIGIYRFQNYLIILFSSDF